MRLMIASDIHGSAYYCRRLIEAFEREKAAFRDTRTVFKRSLDEIDSEAIEIVLEEINNKILTWH